MAELKPLYIFLKGEWYDKFLDGSKEIELRPYGPRWNERTCPPGRPAILSRGYGKKHRTPGVIRRFNKRWSNTKAFKSCYGRARMAALIWIKVDR